MNSKRQFRNSVLSILSLAARAALAIAVVSALTVIVNQSAQAQTPAAHVAWGEKVLHSFNYTGTGDGFWPSGTVIFDAAGNLYGTTELGSSSDLGTVFELTPNGSGGWTEQLLFAFNGPDGYAPSSGLIFDAAGNLYGTTYYGGTYDYGTVFELTPIYPCARCSHAVLPFP